MELSGMHLEVPPSWEDRSTYTFVAPRQKAGVGPVARDDGFRTSIVVTVGPRGAASSLDRASAAAKEKVRMMFGEIAIEESDGPSIAGSPSRRLKYRIVEPGGVLPILQVQCVTIADGTERIFTLTTAAVNARQAEAEIESMLATVRFADRSRGDVR